MKRILCLVLVAIMSIAGVAGAAAEESNPITIQFWNSFTGADGDLLVELVDRFNAENKWGITIEMDISSGFTEQLSSRRWCCFPRRSASSTPTTLRT